MTKKIDAVKILIPPINVKFDALKVSAFFKGGSGGPFSAVPTPVADGFFYSISKHSPDFFQTYILW